LAVTCSPFLAARCSRFRLRLAARAFEQLRGRGEVVDVALGALGLGFDAAPLGERGVLLFGPIERLVVGHGAGTGEHG